MKDRHVRGVSITQIISIDKEQIYFKFLGHNSSEEMTHSYTWRWLNSNYSIRYIPADAGDFLLGFKQVLDKGPNIDLFKGLKEQCPYLWQGVVAGDEWRKTHDGCNDGGKEMTLFDFLYGSLFV